MFVSATTGEGIDDLLSTIGRRLRRQTVVAELLVPYDRGDMLAMAHREGEVLGTTDDEAGWRIVVRVDEGSAGRLADFRVDDPSGGSPSGGSPSDGRMPG